jgi:uncharacterized protein (TIGR03086 family)
LNQAAPLDVLKRACASTDSILKHVSGEQLTLSTPCRDWHVDALVNHIIGATDYFADVAEFGSLPEGRERPDHASGDFVAAFGEQSRRLVAAFSMPGVMQRSMELLNGPATGAVSIQVATGEIFVHGWDLGRATGQEMPADQGVAEALLASVWPSLCAKVRDEHPSVFAAAVPVPRDAPAIDRLVGLLGRDPHWQRGQ